MDLKGSNIMLTIKLVALGAGCTLSGVLAGGVLTLVASHFRKKENKYE